MGGRTRRFGIASVLTLSFGGLIAISTGALLFLSLGNALEITRASLAAKLETLILDAAQESQQYFQPAEEQGRWLSNAIARGDVDPEDMERFSSLLVGAVSTMPQIIAVSYQYPDGTGLFFDAKAQSLQRVEWPRNWQVRLNRSDDNPQTAPPSEGLWVLRPSVITGMAESTFIVPARTGSGDLGVVAVRVELETLSQSLATDAKFRNIELVRFILLNNREVVAHPELQMMIDKARPVINDLKDPFLKALDNGKRYDLTIVGDIDDVETFLLETDDDQQRVFAVMSDESRVSGGKITVGVHFDPSAGSTEFEKLITIAVVGGGLFLGSIIVAIIIGRRAAVPMQQLAHAAQQVQDNKLDEVEPLRVGRVKELAAASTAFNEMVSGLKERVKIRDLFGKYVPQDVANLLLTDDSTAEPKNVQATVLFLDIVGFSSISENMSPAEVVETMNAFFSDAVHLIEEQEGMVTQFQGDAILAVFNVPIERKDHAISAIRAALSILETLERRNYAGHELRCRIGINTGPLVAGAIGAQDRLSYTVYGDAVNVAARLEQMNKEHGTQILLAGPTVDLAEGYNFKKIGKLPIRGRKEPVEVFTLADD